MSQVIVITGMHRSGTSLVSSVLQRAGLHLGDELIAPNVANPRGYFEDVDFYEFHEQMLHARKQSYLYVDEDFTFDPSAAETERARQLVDARSRHSLWGWKDPRTCLFLDFWRQQLPQARYLFVYRHPVEVLLSLVRRGEFDEHPTLAAGLHAWRLYNSRIQAFRDTHPQDCLLVHINACVNNIQLFAERLAAHLSLDIRVDPAVFAQLYQAPELTKTPLPAEVAAILSKLFPGLLEHYQQLNDAADLPGRLDHAAPPAPPAMSTLARLTDSLDEPIDAAIQQSTLQLLVSLLSPAATEKMLRRFDHGAVEQQQKVDQIWLHAQQLERKNLSNSGEMQRQKAQLASQQTVLASQQEQLREQDQVINRQATRLGTLQAEIDRVHAMPAWRMIESIGNVKRIWSRKSPMESQLQYIGTARAADPSIAERIAQIRQLQAELRAEPVTGSLRRLKKMFFRITGTTFSRQFKLNTATVDLIETVYRKLQHERSQLLQQSQQLQDQASRLQPPTAVNGAPNVNGASISTGEVLASCGMTQDQAKLNNIRALDGFNNVYTAPAEMRMPERVALYSLIFGMQPKNCLEVGTFRGGSSAIICGAMDDTGFGRLACVDPMPKIDPELWSRLSGRCKLFTGPSPEILTDVARQMGTPFDFALIDANHTYEYVRRDIAAVLPLLADQAHVLFHDAHYGGVQRAIDEAVAKYPEVTDCGLVSVEPTVLDDNGQSTTWAGLRLLRYQRRGAR